MNKIKLVLQESISRRDDCKPRTRIDVRLTVDDGAVQAFAGIGIDLCALAASARRGGEFYIGNCECGEPGCAGIWEGVQVTHTPRTVRWSIPVPYQLKEGEGDSHGSVIYEFERDAYIAAINRMIAAVSTLLPRQQQGASFDFHGHPGTLVSDIFTRISNSLADPEI